MEKRVVKNILDKAVERLGSRRLWQIPHVVRSAQEEAKECMQHTRRPCPGAQSSDSQEYEETDSHAIPAECLRAALRKIDIFIHDSNFDLLCASCYPSAAAAADTSATRTTTAAVSSSSQPQQSPSLCPGSNECCIDVDAFLHALIEGALSARRQHVVGMVLHRVDPEGGAVVSAETLLRAYNVQRHPYVVNGMRDAASVRNDFAAHLHLSGAAPQPSSVAEGSDPRSVITAEELLFYFAGVSLVTASDTEFELFCVRAFALDSPRDANTARAEAAGANAAAARYSRSAHPLYKTSNADYGKELVRRGATAFSRAKYGLSHKFTRNISARLGGATAMNT